MDKTVQCGSHQLMNAPYELTDACFFNYI